MKHVSPALRSRSCACTVGVEVEVSEPQSQVLPPGRRPSEVAAHTGGSRLGGRPPRAHTSAGTRPWLTRWSASCLSA
eukprot:7355025-Prymnesium_polylepis.1